MANNNHNTALWLVGENVEQKISFEDMRRRSNQMANFLVHRGVKPFDKILLMLPNVAPLWECTLAAIKLPAVMIPTSTLLTAEEIADRIKRANIQHVITSSEEIHKLAQLPINQILVDREEHFYHSEIYQPLVQSKATDPLFHYFTSGTTSKPKLVTHTHQSYPVGHLSTMFWLGLEEQDVHLNISTAGWAKHAWSSFLPLGMRAPLLWLMVILVLILIRCFICWCSILLPAFVRHRPCGVYCVRNHCKIILCLYDKD